MFGLETRRGISQATGGQQNLLGKATVVIDPLRYGSVNEKRIAKCRIFAASVAEIGIEPRLAGCSIETCTPPGPGCDSQISSGKSACCNLITHTAPREFMAGSGAIWAVKLPLAVEGSDVSARIVPALRYAADPSSHVLVNMGTVRLTILSYPWKVSRTWDHFLWP